MTTTKTAIDTTEIFWDIVSFNYGEQFAREEKDTNDR